MSSTIGIVPSSAQDVADAARQERARKEADHKKTRHVYTEDDLKRAQILTPEDRAELEAKRNEQLALDREKTEEALGNLPLGPDINGSSLLPENFLSPLPPDAPLGDVARYYRQWKISQALRREQQFPMSIPKAPVLASPKPIQPMQPFAPLSEPAPPHFDPSQRLKQPSSPSHQVVKPDAPELTPFIPPVKRSPFARPKFFTAEPPRMSSSRPAPSLSTQTPAEPAKPLTIGKPSRPRVVEGPNKPQAHVNPPAISSPLETTKPLGSATPVSPAQPAKPSLSINPSKPVFPSKQSKTPNSVNPPAVVGPLAPTKPFVSGTPVAPAEPKKSPGHVGPSRPVVRATPSQPQVNPPVMASPLEPTKPLSSAVPGRPLQPRKPIELGSPSKPVVPALEPSERVNPPALGAPAHPMKPFASPTPSKPTTPSAPLAPAPPRNSIAPVNPAELKVVTVKSGDSLWKLAQVNLGDGLRWHELLAVNPKIREANHIEAGSQILLPAAVSTSPTATTMTVQKGDSLSKIAREKLGRASSWPCIAGANPTIKDPNLIYAGKKLVVPDSCKK